MARFKKLQRQRDEMDSELAKLRQFLYATLNMVPDEQRSKWEKDINTMIDEAVANTTSLAASIRRVFKENPNMVYSAGAMREQLTERGFDFRNYKSNPISSISTTLRRMVDTGELVTADTVDGPTMFMPPTSLLDEDEKAGTELLKKMARHGSQIPRRRG
ncbi:MAG: hypothetical protein ABSA78_10820 [Candidatus Sulfotelmatobacter sp.]